MGVIEKPELSHIAASLKRKLCEDPNPQWVAAACLRFSRVVALALVEAAREAEGKALAKARRERSDSFRKRAHDDAEGAFR